MALRHSVRASGSHSTAGCTVADCPGTTIATFAGWVTDTSLSSCSYSYSDYSDYSDSDFSMAVGIAIALIHTFAIVATDTTTFTKEVTVAARVVIAV